MTQSAIDIQPPASVVDLCGRHDTDFVQCAYLTMLGRPGDEAGASHYLARLRQGVSKVQILREMLGSAEGRRHESRLAGLSAAIRRRRLATLPLVGWLVRLATGWEGDGAVATRLRAIENNMGGLLARADRDEQDTDLTARIGEIQSRLDWVADYLYRSVVDLNEALADSRPQHRSSDRGPRRLRSGTLDRLNDQERDMLKRIL